MPDIQSVVNVLVDALKKQTAEYTTSTAALKKHFQQNATLFKQNRATFEQRQSALRSNVDAWASQTKTIKSFQDEVFALRGKMDVLGVAVSKNTISFAQSYSKLNDTLQGLTERSSTLREELTELGKQSKLSTSGQERIAEITRELNQIQTRYASTLNEDALMLERSFRFLGERGIELRNEFKRLTQSAVFSREDLNRLSSIMTEVGNAQSRMASKQALLAEHTDKLSKKFFTLSDRVTSAAANFATLESSVALAVAGSVAVNQDLTFAIKHQTGLFSLMSDGAMGVVHQLHMTPLAFQEVVAEFRQMILASAVAPQNLSDATNQAILAMSQLRDQAFDLTGNFNDGGKLIAQVMDTLSSTGVDRTFKELTGRTSQVLTEFKDLTKLTGVSGEVLATQINQHINSASVQEELLQLNEQERRQKYLSILQEAKYYAIQGKNVEATLEAMQALSKIAGISPRDRLKESARIAAVMGALNIEGADRLRKVMMKPAKARTEEDKKFLAEVGTKLEQERGRLLGGDTSQQFKAQALFGSIQSPLYEAMVAAGNQLQEGRRIEEQTAKRVAEGNTFLGTIENFLRTGKEYWEKVQSYFHDPAILFFGSVIAAFGSLIAAIAPIVFNLVQIKRILKRMEDQGMRGGSRGAADDLVDRKRGNRRGKSSKSLRVGGGILGAAGAVMATKDIYDAVTGEEKNRTENLLNSLESMSLTGLAAGGPVIKALSAVVLGATDTALALQGKESFIGSLTAPITTPIVDALFDFFHGDEIEKALAPTKLTDVQQQALTEQQKTNQLLEKNNTIAQQTATAAKNAAETAKTPKTQLSPWGWTVQHGVGATR